MVLGINRANLFLDFHRVPALGRNILDRCCPIEFVPREWTPLDGTLQSTEQDQREYLAIGKALQPDLAEQPCVLTSFGLATLQCKSQGRSEEINDQERSEENQQPMEAGRIVRFRVKVFLYEIPGHADHEHQIN